MVDKPALGEGASQMGGSKEKGNHLQPHKYWDCRAFFGTIG